MMLITLIRSTLMSLLVLGMVCTAQAAEKPQWGKNVGWAFGTVMAKNNSRGLAVRAQPNPRSRVLAYIRVGTTIEGDRKFSNGWMKLKQPVGKGWIQLAAIKPITLDATVVTVSAEKACLPVRRGPAKSFGEVSCIGIGSPVKLTGMWTSGNWAFAAQPTPGWVDASNIRVDFRPESVATRPHEVRKPKSVKAAARSQPVRRAQERRVRERDPFDDPFFDQQRQYQEQMRDAWDDADRFIR